MKKVLLGVVVVALLAVVAGAAVFEPWRLFTDSTVDEAVPTATFEEVEAPAESSSAPVESTTPTAEPSVEPPQDRVLATGDFEDAEHGTSGVAKILQLADGRRFVRLEGLDTSDGPDLHVWLTDQASGGEWGSYDDGRFVRLGELKANHGNQNYEIPDDADLRGMTSVVIWCDRFDVAFGTAPVRL